MKNKINKLENYYKSLKKNLSYSEEKYRNLIELSPVGIITFDIKGNIESCNELVLVYTGYTRKELVGKNFIKLKLLKVTDIHRFIKMVPKILKDKKIPKFEISWKNKSERNAFIKVLCLERSERNGYKNGTSYIGEARLRTIKEENKIIGSHLVVMDITYKKKIEELLKMQRNIANKLSSISNLSKALKVCTDTAIKATGMDCGGVYLVDRETQDINLFYSKGLPRSFIKSASKYSKDSQSAKLVMAGKPIYTQYQKLGVTPDKAKYKEMLLAIAVIPIKHKGSVIACLNMSSHTLSEIPVNARNILESTANLIGGAIERLTDKEALKESEKRLKDIILSTADWIWEVDKNGIYTYCSDKVKDFLKYNKEEIIGKTPFDLMPPEESKRVGKIFQEIYKKKGPIKDLENWNISKDGRKVCLLTNGIPILDEKGSIKGYRGVDKDITDRKKIEEELNESERKYRLLFERSLDGIYRTTVEGKYLDVNQALVKMLGYKNKEELLKIDIPTQLYVKKSDRPGPKERKKPFTIQLRRKDGSIIWAEINSAVIHDIDGIVYYEGIVRDITEKMKTEEKLKYLSFHDKLTGLYNRAYFESELDRLDTKRQLPISIIISDLNSLKLVNDAFGHEEGDKLLKRVANMIKNFFRAEDIIARWGGDEFSIILPKTIKKTAEDIVSRIRKECKKTRSSKIPLSISIGVATKEKPNQNIQSIIREAEDNMYRNKLLEKDSITHSLISSLETSLFEKSHETRKHTDRLNKLTIKLGRASNLAESEIDKLSLLSTLHDIGKVAIPEEILEKEGKLTKSEWNTLKRHPEIGSNICESSPLLVHIASPVLCHHEWWDGNGYPRGIKGDDIPIISRIIAIVDAYDVMTHDRAYSKAITKNKAIEEIKRCSGTQFDSGLVEKFIKIVSD